MERDDMSEAEACELLDDMYIRVVYNLEDPEEVLFEEGLEPDYIEDLIGF